MKPTHGSQLGKDFGLYSSELFVDQVLPGSPAESIGIQSGDRVLRVGGKPVYSFFDLKDQIQKQGETQGEFLLVWESRGVIREQKVQPTRTASRDVLLKPVDYYTVGVTSGLVTAEPDMVIE